MTGPPVLRVHGVAKVYPARPRPVEALREVSFEVPAGRLCVVRGPSGSGKTTLLHLAALLDAPTRGRVELDGLNAGPPDGERAVHWRRHALGMVFQRFHLMPNRTAWQNVLLRFRYLGSVPEDAARRAREALDAVGLGGAAHTPVRLLSGGEMQRVALARALAGSPRLLLADEPTGNLDAESAAQVLRLLRSCCERGIAVVVATHNPAWEGGADLVVGLEAPRPPAPPFPAPSPPGEDSPSVPRHPPAGKVAGRSRPAGSPRKPGPPRGAGLWADVRDGLCARPGRTAVAGGGIALGLFALALALGILRGLRLRSERLAAELGANGAALVRRSAGEPEGLDPLGRARLDSLRAATPGVLWSGAQIRGLEPGPGIPLRMVRTDEHLATLRGWTLREGRWLDPEDLRAGARHAVATEAAMRALGWTPGGAVVLEGEAYRLVGVLAAGPGRDEILPGLARAGEPALFIPWTAGDGGPAGAGAVDVLHVRAPDEGGLRRALERADRVLAGAGGALPPADWITPGHLQRGLRRWRAAIAGTAGVLAGLCLLLGGSSLMNLLLADVRHRAPEIGLRLSLGARPRDIAGLFLAEACAVCLAAALVALGAAGPALLALARTGGLPMEVAGGGVPGLEARLAVQVTAAALLFAGLFSLVPARQAARTPAAEALRND